MSHDPFNNTFESETLLLDFTVHHVTVTGVNGWIYSRSKRKLCTGGALGEAVGGDVDTATLTR